MRVALSELLPLYEISIIVGVLVSGALSVMVGWFTKGLLDDGAKSIAKGLVHGRAARLHESIRADYLEMWLAELLHLSPPGQLVFVAGLFSTSSKRFKPLTPVVKTATGAANRSSTPVPQDDVVVTSDSGIGVPSAIRRLEDWPRDQTSSLLTAHLATQRFLSYEDQRTLEKCLTDGARPRGERRASRGFLLDGDLRTLEDELMAAATRSGERRRSE